MRLSPLNSLLKSALPSVLLSIAASVACAQQDDQLQELRGELDRMRERHEAEIGALKERVDELETERQAAGEGALATAGDGPEPLSDGGQESAGSSPAGGLGQPLPSARVLDRAVLDENKVTRGFSFSGYFRSGFGVAGTGDVMEPFQAPNSQSKYRLGNEGETYVETAFGYSFPDLDLQEGTDFAVVFRPSYVVPDARFDRQSEFSVREAYAIAGGVWEAQPEAAFWAGQRFYDRREVHLTDFFYLDMSGFGGGVEDIAVGDFGTFAVAWIGGSIDTLESNGAVLSETTDGKNSLDLRLYDFDVPAGKGFVWVDLAASQDRVAPNGANVVVEGGTGAAFAFGHEIPDLWGGRNVAMLQYGFGAAANFRSTTEDFAFLNPPPAPAAPLQVDIGDAWHVRFVEDLVVQPSDAFSMQATFVYDEFDSGALLNPKRRWISVGARPVWHLHDHFSVAFEGGFDATRGDGQPSGELYKFTVAPQITPGRDHFSRPAIRLFFTYAFWSDDFVGQVAPGNYRDDNEGLNIGVQAEAWW